MGYSPSCHNIQVLPAGEDDGAEDNVYARNEDTSGGVRTSSHDTNDVHTSNGRTNDGYTSGNHTSKVLHTMNGAISSYGCSMQNPVSTKDTGLHIPH